MAAPSAHPSFRLSPPLRRGLTVAFLLLLAYAAASILCLHEMELRLGGMLESVAPPAPGDPLPPLPPGIRLSLLDPAGRVVADNWQDPSVVPDPSGLPDVLEARERGQGRHLATVPAENRGKTLYLSRALKDGGGHVQSFVRISQAHSEIRTRKFMLFACFALPALALAAGLAAWIRRFGEAKTQPVRELVLALDRYRQGDLTQPMDIEPDHAFGAVAGTLDQLAASVEEHRRILGEQRHRQQVLLSSMSEGILAIDKEERVTEINGLAATWLGAGSPHRARGKILHSLCRNPALLGIVHELFASGEAMEKDLVLERLGEENRILHVRGSLMIDAEQTVGALLVMRDVSSLRKLETLRRDFVANVSHELRTPLTSIKGYAEILCDAGEDRETADRFAEKILRQSERMVEIIDDLLALTRIENNPSPPSMQATQIRPLLEEVLRQCETQAAGRGLTLVLDAPEDLCASLHAPLVEQAMFNLVNNAVKYTHPNTRIHVRAAADNGDLVLEVRDEGPGIEAQHQDRIFERFYRIDKARNRAVGGSGLGLSIVKHIAQVHQGAVSLRSAPGQGATFVLRLPLRPPA